MRAKGSYHSLTPCASTDGTLVDMSRMVQIVGIDADSQIFTAQAGLQIIDASRALREHDLQFMTNIEIGNMTLGAAACCHSKDALDGIEFGQVSSYVTRIKWVDPHPPKTTYPQMELWLVLNENNDRKVSLQIRDTDNNQKQTVLARCLRRPPARRPRTCASRHSRRSRSARPSPPGQAQRDGP